MMGKGLRDWVLVDALIRGGGGPLGHEDELAVGVAGEADLEGGAPVLQGDGAGDRHGEPAVGGEPSELGEGLEATVQQGRGLVEGAPGPR